MACVPSRVAAQRLDANYPNLLATGKGDMLEVTVKDGLLTYKNLGLSSDGEKIFETVTLSKDGAKLAYSDISITPDTVQSNGTVTVSAKVTNVGKGLATASMCVKDNGTDRWLYEFGKSGKERVVGLNPGESATLSAPLTLSALSSSSWWGGCRRAVRARRRTVSHRSGPRQIAWRHRRASRRWPV